MTHDRLVEKAANFLKYKKNCSAVLKEHYAAVRGGETPDVIGWKNGLSYLVECKTSRADFFRDQKKRFRQTDNDAMQVWTNCAMGRYRYYYVPAGLVEVDEVPEGWGLVYLDGRQHKELKKCDEGWNREEQLYFKPNIKSLQNEIRMLSSALRKQLT